MNPSKISEGKKMLTVGELKKRLAGVLDSSIVMVRVLTDDFEHEDGPSFWTTSLALGDVCVSHGTVNITVTTPDEYRAKIPSLRG